MALRGLVLFLYGGATHFILHRFNLHGEAPAGSVGSVLNRTDASFIMAILGGGFVAYFMLRLLPRTLEGEDVRPLRIAFTGGLYGIFATSSALVGFSILKSIILTSEVPTLLSFVFALMGMTTYGMGAIIGSIPFAFLQGTIGGLYILWLRRRSKTLIPTTRGVRGLAKESFVMSVLGLVLVFAPPVGTVLSSLGIIYGARTLRQLDRGVQNHKRLATAAVILGIIGVGFLVFSFGVFLAARMGWI